MKRSCSVMVLVLMFYLVTGCTPAKLPTKGTQIQEVYVAIPLSEMVTDTDVFTGRTDAVNAVEVRARVTGYVNKVFFKDGQDVKKGDPLFEIDPRTYKAEYQRTVADVARAKVHVQRLDTDFTRATALLPRKAISQEEYDKVAGDRAEAEAAVGVSKAGSDLAKQNLDFCTVTAPLEGRISRRLIDPGNLCKADETLLTVIVALDPAYVYFDVDERSLLRFRRLINLGKIQSARVVRITIEMGLADEAGFPHIGYIDFAENRLDAQTGTLRVRGVFPNPDKILSPGLFARVRLPIGTPHKSLLVSERALGTNQGEKFLYIVNESNVIEDRIVKIGMLQGGLRVIEEGLKGDEKVVVSGLQRVRPKVEVTPKLVKMPSQQGDVSKPAAFGLPAEPPGKSAVPGKSK